MSAANNTSTEELREQLVARVCELITEHREDFGGECSLTNCELTFLDLDEDIRQLWNTPENWPTNVYSQYVNAAVQLLSLRHNPAGPTENTVRAALGELSVEMITALEAQDEERLPAIDWRKEGF